MAHAILGMIDVVRSIQPTRVAVYAENDCFDLAMTEWCETQSPGRLPRRRLYRNLPIAADVVAVWSCGGVALSIRSCVCVKFERCWFTTGAAICPGEGLTVEVTLQLAREVIEVKQQMCAGSLSVAGGRYPGAIKKTSADLPVRGWHRKVEMNRHLLAVYRCESTPVSWRQLRDEYALKQNSGKDAQ